MKSISVTLSPELRLEQALQKAGIENPASITKLTVAGMLKKDDLSFMARHMAETLRNLNMKNATVEENRISMFYSDVLTSVILPASLEIIDYYGFRGLPALTSMKIPDGVTDIRCCAFTGCKELVSINIPANVTYIAWCAFLSCVNLTWIDVDCDNACYTSDDGVLFSKDKTVLVQYPAGKPETDYTIPDGVTSIEGGAFDSSKRLKSLTIPASVASIEYGTLEGCDTLTSIICLCSTPPKIEGFYSCLFSRCRLYVPQKWLHLYRNSEQWKVFACAPIKKKKKKRKRQCCDMAHNPATFAENF